MRYWPPPSRFIKNQSIPNSRSFTLTSNDCNCSNNEPEPFEVLLLRNTEFFGNEPSLKNTFFIIPWSLYSIPIQSDLDKNNDTGYRKKTNEKKAKKYSIE